MLSPEHRSSAEGKNRSSEPANVVEQAIVRRTVARDLFPSSKQELLRGLVLREVLGKPKCMQSSTTKHF